MIHLGSISAETKLGIQKYRKMVMPDPILIYALIQSPLNVAKT